MPPNLTREGKPEFCRGGVDRLTMTFCKAWGVIFWASCRVVLDSFDS
jgi:hypothetical protein